MSDYGIRLTDGSDTSILVPDHMTVVSAGRLTLPVGLNGDNTYGTDIALPTSNVPKENIGVLVIPQGVNYSTNFTGWISGSTLLFDTHYANSGTSYYTRNDSTGVMTTFTAGAKTVSNKSTWNSVFATYPVAFWDQMGATTFNNVRLFGASAYCVRVPINDTNLALAGDPSSSSGGLGQPAYINDDDVNTVYYNYRYTYHDHSETWGYTAIVDFGAPKVITKVQLSEAFELLNVLVEENYEIITISIYYSGAWHIINNYIIYAPQSATRRTVETTGFWNNVEQIKMRCSAHIHGANPNPYALAGAAAHFTEEFRAFGGDYSDAAENKLIYSIGTSGVQTVDYLVCIKEYDI